MQSCHRQGVRTEIQQERLLPKSKESKKWQKSSSEIVVIERESTHTKEENIKKKWEENLKRKASKVK